MSNDARSNLYVVSSPSGGGKSTLANRAVRGFAGLKFSISYTTRPPRPGEENGREYFFVPEEEFFQLRERHALLEWARVFGNYYGTSREQVERSRDEGIDLILDVDIQGARQIRQSMPGAVLVFVLPPSYAILRERLITRNTDGRYDIEHRLSCAREEVKAWNEFDYIIVNDVVERAASSLMAIIEADRHRRSRQTPGVLPILETFEGELRQ